LYSVDGTGLSLPDTASNQAAYPQSVSQKAGCAFPLMKVGGLFSLASGAWLHFQLVVWQKPFRRPTEHHPKLMAALPKQLTLRQIRLRVQIKSFRSQTILLVTTLLDPVTYPAEEIRQLYLQRWSVGLHFREIKTLLALDVLRCRSSEMIEKELLVQVIAYNIKTKARRSPRSSVPPSAR
jgi:hypothetical protein